MRKGFIGPIGDDLPAMIAVMLALGLFFSGVVVALNTYNQKISSLSLLNAGMDVSRALLSAPVFEQCSIEKDVTFIAASYGVAINALLKDDSGVCVEPASRFFPEEVSCDGKRQYVSFTYLVGLKGPEGVVPATLAVRVCKP